MMWLAVLGDCFVSDSSRRPVSLSAPDLTVLCLLLANANRPVHPAALADALDDNGHGRGEVSAALGRLRTALGPESITDEPAGVVLWCDDADLDARVFEAKLTQARQHLADFDSAMHLLDEGLALWRGPAFGAYSSLALVRTEAERLENMRISAEELRIDLLLDQGRDGEALDKADEALARNRGHSNLNRQRILALYRTGRRTDALVAYRVLIEELTARGQAPSEALRALEVAMVLERPRLDSLHSAPRELDVGSARTHDAELEGTAATGTAMVGRTSERRWLRARLREVANGTPCVVLVEGEAGVGKTCLTRFIANEVVATGWQVLSVRCDERIDTPLWPLTSNVLPALAEVAESQGNLRRYANQLRDLAELRPFEDTSKHTIAERYRAFRDTLKALAATRQVLILVDDLQWADPATFDLLVSAVRMLDDATTNRPCHLAIIAAARLGGDSPRSPLVEQLRREPATSRLVLGGLSELEIAEFVRLLGIQHAPPGWVTELARVARGNPLFVESAVRHSQATGRLSPDEFLANLPTEIHTVVHNQLIALDEPARELAAFAAVAGEPWDIDLLAELLDKNRDQIADLIEELVEHGVGVVNGDVLRFAHPLYEQSALSTINAFRRQRIHARVADYLIGLRTRRSRISALQIFRHLVSAGELVDVDVARAVAEEAAVQAESLFAWADAARGYEASLEWFERSGQKNDATWGQLLLKAGSARLHNAEPRVALQSLEKSTQLLEGAGDDIALARAWVARVQAQAVTAAPGSAIQTGNLEELAERIEATAPREAAYVWANLVQAYWITGRIELARSAALRAIELGATLNDHESAVWALWNRAMAEWSTLELVEARESLNAAAEHGAHLRDRKQLTGPMMRRPLSLFWTGGVAEAAGAADDAETLSKEVNYNVENGLFWSARALIAMARGALNEAEEACSSCLLLEATTGYPWATPLVLPTLARLRMLRDDVPGLAAVLSRWVKRGTGSTQSRAAELFRALADGGYAIEGRPIDGEELRLGSDTSAGLAIELAFERDTPELCEGAAQMIEQLRARGQIFTTTTAMFTPRLCALSSALYRQPDATNQLIAARQQAEALRLHLEVAYCEYAIGTHYKRLGDMHFARQSLRDARDLAATIGAELLARRCNEAIDTSRGGYSRSSRAEPAQDSAETVVILFVDIAESTTLTEQLGDWVFRSRSRALEQQLRASVDRNGGSSAFGVTLGDGILADFPSARNAATCALECAALAERDGLPVHIGLHAGDVLREADTIFGGAVNLAARLCSLSAPSEVLVSQTFRELARTSTQSRFEDKGLHSLKGIGEPVRVFAMQELTADNPNRHLTPVA